MKMSAKLVSGTIIIIAGMFVAGYFCVRHVHCGIKSENAQNSSIAPPKQQISDEEVRRIFDGVFSRYNLTNENYRTDQQRFRIQRSYHPTFGREVVVASNGIDIEIDPYTGALLGIADLYSRIGTPQDNLLSEAEVTAFALSAVKDLFGPLPPDIAYGYTLQRDFRDEKYWEVMWYRKVGSYTYPDDFIKVNIRDNNGKPELIFFLRKLESEPCPINIKLSQDDAEKIALDTLDGKFAERIRSGKGEYVLKPISETKLEIINPNQAYRDKETGKNISPQHARLAYKVRIPFEKKDRNDITEVWVDAETGEILGGL